MQPPKTLTVYSMWIRLINNTYEVNFIIPLTDIFYPQFLAPRDGFEPTTLGLEVLCSIQLSYRGID